jgi:hypothetical protein
MPVDVLDSMIEGAADALRRRGREAIARTRHQDDVLDALKALSKGHERDPIRTVRAVGYAFDENFGKR